VQCLLVCDGLDVLYGVISHWMVITEEEHLQASLGEEYVRYCQKVPRYLF
jgi:protein-S-isoprenylcysteine O-methyltransferase Ste14